MKYKNLFIVIIGLSIVALLGIIGIWLKIEKNKETSIGEEQKMIDEKLIQETKKDVEVLNENSYFFGFHLLDKTPSDFNGSVVNALPVTEEDSEVENTYHCQIYDGKMCITQIYFQSTKAHVFDIHVGDSKEDIAIVLEQQGYVKESDEDMNGKWVFTYNKNHIAICFFLTNEGVIEEIGITVHNPNEIQLDY